ncbi:MAG: ATP cone domain-containing protein [Planctomycetota bacterium]
MRGRKDKGRTERGGEGEPAAAARPEPARARIELVKKRDGRIVPFQRQKIAEAVQKAMEAAGELDVRFAGEVAAIVELSLVERLAVPGEGDPAARVPHIETIQDLVERALMELGRANVAKAYILHRDLRARVRSVLRVHRSDTLRAPVRVREREGVSDWQKGRIVAALMQEAELPREAAEDVASAVERRVFAAQKRSVTTGLIRELVASELFERGWLAALTAARVVGISRLDVKRALAGQLPRPWRSLRPKDESAPRAADLLAGEITTRYALESLLSEAAGELHRNGDLSVVGLTTLGRPLTMCVEAELFSRGGDPTQAAYSVLDELAELLPSVAEGVVLERPAVVLSPLVRSARENSPHGIAAWLRALAALARGARVRIDLGSSGPRYHAASARLVEELSELEGPFAPRLFLDGNELETLLEERPDLAPTVERLLASERLLPSWSTSGETFAGPGCTRREGERGLIACGGAIALNLPRLARRAGPFREELFQGGVAELVQAAVGIAEALESAQQGAPRPGGLRARTSFTLVPVGLREALLALGDGAIDCELAGRLLGFMGEAARRFGRGQRLEPCASPFHGDEAAARFAFLDARAAAGTRQEWLFGEAEAERAELAAYTRGFQLSPVNGLAAGRAEAEALRTVPVGALAFGSLAARELSERPALDAWRRFEVVRRARSGELVLELFSRSKAREADERPTRLRPLV